MTRARQLMQMQDAHAHAVIRLIKARRRHRGQRVALAAVKRATTALLRAEMRVRK